MESNSTAFLIKIKLRHSLGRASRSDFVQSGFLSAGAAAGIGLLDCNMSSSHSVLYLFSHFLFNFLILLNALYRRFSIITYDGRTFCNFIDSSTFQTYLNISLVHQQLFLSLIERSASISSFSRCLADILPLPAFHYEQSVS